MFVDPFQSYSSSICLRLACGFVPAVLKMPLQKHYQKQEGESQHSRGQHKRKQIIRLQLGGSLQNRIAQPAFSPTRFEPAKSSSVIAPSLPNANRPPRQVQLRACSIPERKDVEDAEEVKRRKT